MTVPRGNESQNSSFWWRWRSQEPKNQNMRLLVKWELVEEPPGLGIKIPVKIHGSALSYTVRSHHNLLLSSGLSVRPSLSRSLTGSQKYKEKSKGLKTNLGPVQSYAEDRLAQSHNSAYGLSFKKKRSNKLLPCLREMPSIYWFWRKHSLTLVFRKRSCFFFFFLPPLDQISLPEEQQQHKQCVPLWIKKKITNYIELLLSYFRLKKKKRHPPWQHL